MWGKRFLTCKLPPCGVLLGQPCACVLTGALLPCYAPQLSYYSLLFSELLCTSHCMMSCSLLFVTNSSDTFEFLFTVSVFLCIAPYNPTMVISDQFYILPSFICSFLCSFLPFFLSALVQTWQTTFALWFFFCLRWLSGNQPYSSTGKVSQSPNLMTSLNFRARILKGEN